MGVWGLGVRKQGKYLWVCPSLDKASHARRDLTSIMPPNLLGIALALKHPGCTLGHELQHRVLAGEGEEGELACTHTCTHSENETSPSTCEATDSIRISPHSPQSPPQPTHQITFNRTNPHRT
jgi:hypothetical protein